MREEKEPVVSRTGKRVFQEESLGCKGMCLGKRREGLMDSSGINRKKGDTREGERKAGPKLSRSFRL